MLTWLDGLLLLFLLFSAVGGTRRGFLLGALDLVGAAATALAVLLGYGPVVAWLRPTLPQLPPVAADLLALLGLVLLAQAVYSVFAGLIVRALFAPLLTFRPVRAVDRLLGLVPGLLRGLVLATLLLVPFALLPVVPGLGRAIQDSPLASRLVDAALTAAPEVESRIGADLASGLSGLILTPRSPDEVARVDLQIGSPGPLAPDPDAERQMLDLVNAERARTGLRPLAADEGLQGVARAHSQEMFERAYFAHESPTAGSPYDRMRAAGIPFFLAGENLAYAPTVQLAHEGLMRSPGHRANILRPEFGRVGIGVIRSQLRGSMFTQDFRN